MGAVAECPLIRKVLLINYIHKPPVLRIFTAAAFTRKHQVRPLKLTLNVLYFKHCEPVSYEILCEVKNVAG